MENNKDQLLYATFNQDGSCFCVGTKAGYNIYNSYPLKLTCERKMDNGIEMIEMLNRCNVLALINQGDNTGNESNIILWDDLQGKEITHLTVKFNVKNIQLKRTKIFIIGEKGISVFTLGNFQNIDTITTYQNKNGIIGVSKNPQINIIAYPSPDIGKIVIKNYDEEINNNEFKSSIIKAHQSEITALVMNDDGSLLASASEKGTIIRVFQTKDGQLIQELRRGSESAEIYSLAFDMKSAYLACSSNKGTIHIFNIKNEENKAKNQKSIFGTLTSFIGIQSEYLNSEWSFAQYRLNYKGKSVVSFCPDGSPSVMVITMEGKYYQGSFDPVKGGECSTSLEKEFTKLKIEEE